MGVDIHKVIEKIPFKPLCFTEASLNRTLQPRAPATGFKRSTTLGQEPYNAVDAIAMRHDICYGNNENGKADCDRKMLAELNALAPRGRREKVDRQLVRGMIGLKHRLGMGVHWSSQLADQLHKPARKRYQKRSVFAKQVDDIWTADLVDMSQGWTPDINANAAVANTGFTVHQRFPIQSPEPKGSFQCAIPMRHIFDFTDDYTKVTYGMRDTLQLVR